MSVTLADLAKAAGVSISTVSRALTGSDHPVNEKTRQRILRLADELGYEPNLLARGLRSDCTFTIGVILDNISSPFAPPVVRGIQDEVKRANYSIILTNSDWDPVVEAESVRTFISRPVDGIIFVDTWLHSANEEPPPSEKPYVFVNRLFGATDCNCIGPDDRYGAQLAAGHLARLGHRRIAFINGPEGWEASLNRLAGYRDALAAYGLPFDRALVRCGTWEVRDGYRAARELIALADPPTAIFAGNDFMAIGAIYALQDAGLHVPKDVAVVGYDDREVASLVRPALTTVTLPCYEMGEAAARLILSQLEDQAKPATAEQVRGRLVVRESCGAEEVKGGEKEFWAHTTPRRLLYETPRDMIRPL
jgi:LacI family transcriptional regulator